MTEKAPATAFRPGSVEADGLRIRYVDAGQGIPLVHVPGAGGLSLTPAHGLLCRSFRVVTLETPGLGRSPEASGTQSMSELASTMAQAVTSLGLDTFNLMGSSVGSTLALWLALQSPERVPALVLEAPVVDAEVEHLLPTLVTPTLVLFGTRDTVVAPAKGRVYKALIPGSHLVFVYDAAHAISADRPDAFAEVVADFLERREAFVISRTKTVIHP